MFKEGEDAIVFVLFLAGLLAVLLIAGVVWFLIAATIASVSYANHIRQAEAEFDRVAAEIGIDLDTDEVLRAVYGAGIELPEDGYGTVGEWVAGSVFGVEEVAL